MIDYFRPRLLAATFGLTFALSGLAGCSGGGNSVQVSKSSDCGSVVASATRSVKDQFSDDPPWAVAGSANETYNVVAQRNSDYYDSDISGAPTHDVTSGGGGKHNLSGCNTPSSATRISKSYTTVTRVCWYQAAISGVHEPEHDTFLGCDVDAQSYGSTTGQPMGGQLADRKGKPVDGATCSGSPHAVSETISISGLPDTNIADINAIWNGNKEIGWFYLGDDGNRYIQFNYANRAGFSAGVGYGLFSVGISSPGGYSDVYHWNGTLEPGSRVRKCFTGGKQLV